MSICVDVFKKCHFLIITVYVEIKDYTECKGQTTSETALTMYGFMRTQLYSTAIRQGNKKVLNVRHYTCAQSVPKQSKKFHRKGLDTLKTVALFLSCLCLKFYRLPTTRCETTRSAMLKFFKVYHLPT